MPIIKFLKERDFQFPSKFMLKDMYPSPKVSAVRGNRVEPLDPLAMPDQYHVDSLSDLDYSNWFARSYWWAIRDREQLG
jgi:hypothetical protein